MIRTDNTCSILMLNQTPLHHIDGLMQKRHNSIANTLELCLYCSNPSIYSSLSTVLDILHAVFTDMIYSRLEHA